MKNALIESLREGVDGCWVCMDESPGYSKVIKVTGKKECYHCDEGHLFEVRGRRVIVTDQDGNRLPTPVVTLVEGEED